MVFEIVGDSHVLYTLQIKLLWNLLGNTSHTLLIECVPTV